MQINSLVLAKERNYEKPTGCQQQFVDLLWHEKAIKEMLSEIQVRFLQVAYRLEDIERSGVYKVCHDNLGNYCKNIYQYALIAFGFSKSTVCNLLGITKKFTEHMNLKEEYRGYGLSQLVELLSVPQRLHKYFSPKMTIKEIKDLKAGRQVWGNSGVWCDRESGYIEIPDNELQKAETVQTSGQIGLATLGVKEPLPKVSKTVQTSGQSETLYRAIGEMRLRCMDIEGQLDILAVEMAVDNLLSLLKKFITALDKIENEVNV